MTRVPLIYQVTKKPAPEYPTAGTGIGVRVYSDRGKRIGPVFSPVGKVSNIFEPCPFEANLVSGFDGRRRLNKKIYWPHQNRGFLL